MLVIHPLLLVCSQKNHFSCLVKSSLFKECVEFVENGSIIESVLKNMCCYYFSLTHNIQVDEIIKIIQE
jgi:hypothetical protein